MTVAQTEDGLRAVQLAAVCDEAGMVGDGQFDHREALLGELDSYRAQLDELRLALAQNDGERLEEVFGIARQARREWAGD